MVRLDYMVILENRIFPWLNIHQQKLIILIHSICNIGSIIIYIIIVYRNIIDFVCFLKMSPT